MPAGPSLVVGSAHFRTCFSNSRLRYCALHQLTIHQTYSDDGVSGTVPVELRPLGARLLEDARQHQFDQLLVFKLDRLGRDTRLILNTVAELEKEGVRVRSMRYFFMLTGRRSADSAVVPGRRPSRGPDLPPARSRWLQWLND
jgi:hypothetical protein